MSIEKTIKKIKAIIDMSVNIDNVPDLREDMRLIAKIIGEFSAELQKQPDCQKPERIEPDPTGFQAGFSTESYCLNCDKCFGIHDTKILKSMWRKHKCKNNEGIC
jgi:hypothetical protein